MSKLKLCIFTLALFVANVTFAANIKAVVFDCDGTLIDNGSAYFLEWEYALQRQGYELTSDAFWSFMNENRLLGFPHVDEKIVSYCCKLLGRDAAREIMEDKNAFSKQLHENNEFPPIQATIDFLRRLVREKEHLGIKIGLSSGNTKQQILKTLKKFGIDYCFDAIVSGCEDLAEYSDPDGTNKPKPYVYLETARLLGVLPDECIAIEDSFTGISSAVSAGCIAVAIPNSYTLAHDFSHAHLRIDSFDGLDPSDFLMTIDALISCMHGP